MGEFGLSLGLPSGQEYNGLVCYIWKSVKEIMQYLIAHNAFLMILIQVNRAFWHVWNFKYFIGLKKERENISKNFPQKIEKKLFIYTNGKYN